MHIYKVVDHQVVPANSGLGISPEDTRKKISKTDLVYMDDSPNFCKLFLLLFGVIHLIFENVFFILGEL